MENTVQPPLPGETLFRNLVLTERQDPFDRIHEGICACTLNAKRLLEDVKLLAGNDRFSSTLFLATTAREEFAKSYLLFDICRLDFERHQSVIKKLCKAFYDHIRKYAYLEVLEFSNINSMLDVKQVWDAAIQKYWLSTSEEEPDLPHEVSFTREFPLYVDFIDYDQDWSLPNNISHKTYFEEFIGTTLISRLEDLVGKIENDLSTGYLGPDLYRIVNDIFKHQYVWNHRFHLIQI